MSLPGREPGFAFLEVHYQRAAPSKRRNRTWPSIICLGACGSKWAPVSSLAKASGRPAAYSQPGGDTLVLKAPRGSQLQPCAAHICVNNCDRTSGRLSTSRFSACVQDGAGAVPDVGRGPEARAKSCSCRPPCGSRRRRCAPVPLAVCLPAGSARGGDASCCFGTTWHQRSMLCNMC